MKKTIHTRTLTLKHETVKQLKADCMKLVAGGAPVRTRELPCIELTSPAVCG